MFLKPLLLLLHVSLLFLTFQEFVKLGTLPAMLYVEHCPKTLSELLQKVTLDIQNLKKGVHLVKIWTDEGMAVKKVLIE